MRFSLKPLAAWVPGFLILVLGIGPISDSAGCLGNTKSRASKTTTKKPKTQTPSKKKSIPSSKTSGRVHATKTGSQLKTAKSRSQVRKSSKTSRKKRVRGQREIESSRVLEIQQALRSAGFYKQDPTGEWDASTIQAMSAYQTNNGFKVTGKPDALSLKKLGL